MRARDPFRPIRLVDLEIREAVADVEALQRYGAVRGLVRLHGVPLGYMQVEVEQGRVSARRLLDAVLLRDRGAIVRQRGSAWSGWSGSGGRNWRSW